MNSKVKIIGAIAAIAIVVVSGALLYQEFFNKFVLLKKVAGVEVYSKIPVDEFQNKETIGLHEMAGKAETSCNFEISAVSKADRKGYDVRMERGPMGIYLDAKGAFIRGQTDEELLKACHAFVCLKEDISCTSDMMEIRNMTLKFNDMVIVLDNRSRGKALDGYVQLSGALGFVQAQIIDTNKDGTVDQQEANKSKTHIYPYIMEGDKCVLQRFKNVLEELNITNDTASCDDFRSGIFLTKSNTNSITIDGSKTIISGDDEGIYAGSIIVRDILSPEYIRYLNRVP